MRNFKAVYIRELRSYFTSPVFYIIATVFVLVIGNAFKDTFFTFSMQTMRALFMYHNYQVEPPLANINDVASSIFNFMNFISILIIPLLTMRLYAEERKNGTMELLMTSPITTTQVLLGKFFSCLTVYTCLILLTVVFNIILSVYSGGRLDWGIIFSSYLGTFLLGSTLISIGIFFSSLTENQIIAAAVSLTFAMGLWLLVYTSHFMSPPMSFILRYISLSEHVDYFNWGLIAANHVTYYISMTFFWLFLTAVSVESLRWRQ